MFESTGLFLAWFACTYLLVQIILGTMDAFREVDTELREKIRQRLDTIVHRVEVVEENSMFYWYDQDNRNFLAQGRTTEEIVAVLKERFPDHIFYFEKSNHLICAKHGWEPQPAQLTDKS